MDSAVLQVEDTECAWTENMELDCAGNHNFSQMRVQPILHPRICCMWTPVHNKNSQDSLSSKFLVVHKLCIVSFHICNQRYCRVMCTFIDLARFLHVITSNWRSGATLDHLLKLLFVDCWMALLNSDTVRTDFVLVPNLKLKLLFMMTILESTHNNFCNRPK